MRVYGGMGGVRVLVKVFKKQKQYVSDFQLKFKEI